jgi:hypothetical protein
MPCIFCLSLQQTTCVQWLWDTPTILLYFLYISASIPVPRGKRRGSASSRLLGLWDRIPLRTWMSVFFKCCVLAGVGLCDGPIARPEESYRVSVVYLECDREASVTRRPRLSRAFEPWQKCRHNWALIKDFDISYLIVHFVRSQIVSWNFSLT